MVRWIISAAYRCGWLLIRMPAPEVLDWRGILERLRQLECERTEFIAQAARMRFELAQRRMKLITEQPPMSTDPSSPGPRQSELPAYCQLHLDTLGRIEAKMDRVCVAIYGGPGYDGRPIMAELQNLDSRVQRLERHEAEIKEEATAARHHLIWPVLVSVIAAAIIALSPLIILWVAGKIHP